jgi:hypothetical protein
MKPLFFRGPLHCAIVSKDGFLYACDRGNNRIQVFDINEVGKGACANPVLPPHLHHAVVYDVRGHAPSFYKRRGNAGARVQNLFVLLGLMPLGPGKYSLDALLSKE